MNTLKGWISTTCLAAMLMASTVTANAGVIIGGFSGEPSPAPCTETKGSKNNLGGVIIGGLGGVIIGGFTGVIIGGFTGVITGGVSNEPVENCGVIIGG